MFNKIGDNINNLNPFNKKKDDDDIKVQDLDQANNKKEEKSGFAILDSVKSQAEQKANQFKEEAEKQSQILKNSIEHTAQVAKDKIQEQIQSKKEENNNQDLVVEQMDSGQQNEKNSFINSLNANANNLTSSIKQVGGSIIEQNVSFINKAKEEKNKIVEKAEKSMNDLAEDINEVTKRAQQNIIESKRKLEESIVLAEQSMQIYSAQLEAGIKKMEDKAKNKFKDLSESAQKGLKDMTQNINSWVQEKVVKTLDEFTDHLRIVAKQKFVSPSMPNCVVDTVESGINTVWPDIKDDIKLQIGLLQYEQYVYVNANEYSLICFPCHQVRRHYLYALYPFDKSFWALIQSFQYWFWYLVSIFPFYGVSGFYYTLDFLMRDKGDEYQLLSYLVSSKSMMFFTLGVQKGLIGFYLLFACTTMSEMQNVPNTCSTQGPGAVLIYYSEIIGFLIQVLLLWIAFILMQFSVQKGKPRIKYPDERPDDEYRGCMKKGSLAKFILFLDTFLVFGGTALYVLLYYSQSKNSIENVKDFLFVTEVSYGLASFPFVMFNIPGLKNFLIQIKPTGYDPYCNCVSIKKEDEKEEDNQQKGEFQQMFKSIDVGKVFE